jgi:hypothetical protein
MCKACGMRGGKHKSGCKYVSKGVPTGVLMASQAGKGGRLVPAAAKHLKNVLPKKPSVESGYVGRHAKKDFAKSAFGVTHY